uniref:Secreted protein n=1 Tax=Onchocerca volvulus TaxID=6282 RepID=A0A8R1XVY6_ONCVO
MIHINPPITAILCVVLTFCFETTRRTRAESAQHSYWPSEKLQNENEKKETRKASVIPNWTDFNFDIATQKDQIAM